MTTYSTIVADPPWPYESDHIGSSPAHRPNSWNNPKGRVSSVNRYGQMSIDELCALQIPAANNAHLYLWTTNTFLVEEPAKSALRVVRAWGFVPKTVITWGKIKPDGTPSMKAGYYYRGATEHIIFAVKGRLRLVDKSNPDPTLVLDDSIVLSPRLEHSKKPAWFYEMVERQSPGPYLELFGRAVTPMFPKMEGWHTWGNEIGNDVELTA